MAYTPISLHVSSRISTGITYATVDTTNGNSFDNASGKVMLLVHNDTGGSLDLVIATPFTQDGLVLGDLTVTIAAGETHILGPFPGGIYNQDDSADNDLPEAVVIKNTSGALKVCPVKMGSLA